MITATLTLLPFIVTFAIAALTPPNDSPCPDSNRPC
jgi:hypothetical protein